MDLRIICCDTCEGAGRYDLYGHEYECHVCVGTGSVQIELQPITMDDLDEMEAA
jgi:DnaJ-class molecular chaperone